MGIHRMKIMGHDRKYAALHVPKMALFFLIIVQIFCMPVNAGEIPFLCVEEPPASYVDSRGRAAGFVVDIAREMQKRLGLHDSITVLTEARAWEYALTNPDVILFSFSRLPDRENLFHWVVPVMHKSWVLYGRRSDSGAPTTIAAARNMRVGAVRGDVRAEWLRRHGFTHIEEVATHEQNVRKLHAGRLDLIFYEQQGMVYACSKLQIDMQEFTAVLSPMSSTAWILLSKPGTSPILLEGLRKAAADLQAEGVFVRIADHWAASIRKDGINCSVDKGVLVF